MIHRLSEKYGLLPSETLQRATTLDLVILDISLNLENHAQQSSDPNYIPPVSTEELLKIKERA